MDIRFAILFGMLLCLTAEVSSSPAPSFDGLTDSGENGGDEYEPNGAKSPVSDENMIEMYQLQGGIWGKRSFVDGIEELMSINGEKPSAASDDPQPSHLMEKLIQESLTEKTLQEKIVKYNKIITQYQEGN